MLCERGEGPGQARPRLPAAATVAAAWLLLLSLAAAAAAWWLLLGEKAPGTLFASGA